MSYLLELCLTYDILLVQLVPGAEVAVAPKRRKQSTVSHKDSSEVSSNQEHVAKALLRIQDADTRLIHKTCVKGVELGVVLTSVAIIHPETAKRLSLDSLQYAALVPRLSTKGIVKNSENDGLKVKGSSASKPTGRTLTDKREHRQSIVFLLISDSVAKGHVMISRSLRLYLRASLHSCVFHSTSVFRSLII